MELDILLRRYARLRLELAAAYRSLPWQSSRIDPLTDDLADVERHLVRHTTHREIKILNTIDS